MTDSVKELIERLKALRAIIRAPSDVMPVTDSETDHLHDVGWNSGFGWRDDLDWYDENDSYIYENDELKERFLSDLRNARSLNAMKKLQKMSSTHVLTLCDSYLALRERVGELEGDAAKWRTLIASERIRIMGYTHDLKHVGLELWRKHRAKHPCEDFPQDKCRDILEAYVAGETEAPARKALEAKS